MKKECILNGLIKITSESITFEIIWDNGHKTYGEYPSETFNKLKANYKRDFPSIKDINILLKP
ncbi:MAG: hypothetical protein MUP85_01290 [Candidatus Lokiarchaeota archaeon]|nr:hypothetical protein [Candidatus Lokiarchaeota archaeon]